MQGRSISPSTALCGLTNIIAGALILAFLKGYQVPLFLSYFTHKIWHIVGAILLIGHAFTGAVWFIIAWLKEDQKLLKFSVECYRLLDLLCTLPGVLLLTVNGLAMASVYKDEVSNRWILQSLWLVLGASFFSFLLLLPIQERLFHLAESGPPNAPALKRMWIAWSITGTAIFLPFGAVFYLMVTKQPFTF